MELTEYMGQQWILQELNKRSELFLFTPRYVPPKKSIGTLAKGDTIEYFAVQVVKNTQGIPA